MDIPLSPPDPRRQGRYRVADAAHIVGLHQARVRRWLGFADTPRGPTVVRGADAPLHLVSFLDLVELDMVKQLLGRGFRLPPLRAMLQEAAARVGVDHPLARHRFLVGEGHLFLEQSEGVLRLGSGGQMAVEEVIRGRASVLDFAGDGLATRWWPMGHGKLVVVDPEMAWGEPRINNTRLTTRAIAQAVRGEGGDVERTARIYQLDVESVRQALEYEGLLAA